MTSIPQPSSFASSSSFSSASSWSRRQATFIPSAFSEGFTDPDAAEAVAKAAKQG